MKVMRMLVWVWRRLSSADVERASGEESGNEGVGNMKHKAAPAPDVQDGLMDWSWIWSEVATFGSGPTETALNCWTRLARMPDVGGVADG